jgi:hypothetical protein
MWLKHVGGYAVYTTIMYIFVYAYFGCISRHESSAYSHESYTIHLRGLIAHNEHVLT